DTSTPISARAAPDHCTRRWSVGTTTMTRDPGCHQRSRALRAAVVFPAPGHATSKKLSLSHSLRKLSCHSRSVLLTDAPFPWLHLGHSACPLVTSVSPPALNGWA